RPIEDGSNTQYRLAVIECLIPPRSEGPIFHFHEMHDEGFFCHGQYGNFGLWRAAIEDPMSSYGTPILTSRPTVDMCAGEVLTVPVRLPHKFSNPFDEEAVFINTATPGFFIRYFELLENMIGEGKVLTPEINAEALKRFATIPIPLEDVERLQSQGWPSVNGKGT
ncbi:hypothetical protein DHEL01_v212069, partial [Diaporthe helianthi]